MEIRLLKPTEVAAYLRISRSLAYRLIQQGQIKTLRFGRTVRVSEADLQDFIAANTTEGSSWMIGDRPFRLAEKSPKLVQRGGYRHDPDGDPFIDRRSSS